MKKRMLATLLCLCMVVSLLPQTAFAAGNNKAMQLGSTVLEENQNTSTAATLYYGMDSSNVPYTWRVIGYDGVGAATASGSISFLAKAPIENSAFNSNNLSPNPSHYGGSDLKVAVEVIAARFSLEEKAAMAKRRLASGTYDGINTDGIAGSEVTEASLWPLSTKEANAVNAVLRQASDSWWLRSPGLYAAEDVAFVNSNGDVSYEGYIPDDIRSVRPAFSLNLSYALFTSAAAGGKSSGNLGAGALSPVSDYTGNEWKLTLQDNSRAGFSATVHGGGTSATALPGGSVSIDYSGAKTGANEYISAMITDSSNKILYYGNITDLSGTGANENGTAQLINIPNSLPVGSYTLKIFNEQCNGDKKTDYASAFRDITLTVTPANNTVPAINAGAGVLKNGANTDAAAKVYYGNDGSNPINWCVIGYDGAGAVTTTGRITLLVEDNIGNYTFFKWAGSNNHYNGSDLQAAMGTLASKFTTEETAAIRARTLDGIAGSPVLDALLWPLSTAEATATYINLRKASFIWWLRSPGSSDNDAAIVHGDGNVYGPGDVVNMSFGVRPAFHLNLSSVLFTSAAAGGKSSGAIGAGALSPVSDTTSNEWKLTLQDANRSSFSATVHGGGTSATASPGVSVSIDYSGAKTGANEYISAMITDSSNKILYYGNITDLSVAGANENGTAQQINIPAALPAGSYTLKIFNEQCNGDKKTDYASAFRDIALTITAAHNPVPAINAGAGVLKNGANTSAAATVYYGKDTSDNPIGWRIIGYDGHGAAAKGGSMTLLAQENLGGTTRFSDDMVNTYSGSKLEQVVKNISDKFSGTESVAIINRTLDVDAFKDSPPYSNGVEGGAVSDARLWPLSTAESTATDSDLLKAGKNWWLRSPGNGANLIAYVNPSGTVQIYGIYSNGILGVRPAFHLNLSSVLFTSAAGPAGKSSGATGAGALSPVLDYTGNEWKTTILDSSRQFLAAARTYNDTTKTVALDYSGATVGESEYISTIIKNSGGKITHYGRITQSSSASGILSINLSGKMNAGDKLYVFSEQLNGDYTTDLASALQEINTAPTSSIQANPNTLSFGSVHTGYSQPAAQTVTITNTGNQSVTVTLPVSTNYTITVAAGFTDNQAILGNHGDTAAFRVTPKAGLSTGTYDETMILSGTNEASAAIPLTFSVKSSGSGSSSTTYYTLTFETNGGSKIDRLSKSDGTTIDLKPYNTEKEGYNFNGWYSDKALTDKITSVRLTENRMIYAGWTKKTVSPTNPSTGFEHPFTDVSISDWFYDDVMFVYGREIMTGTSNTTFSPHNAATRGMMATILWRMEGSPAVTGKIPYPDVASGKYYTDAVIWTTQKGIFSGYEDKTFRAEESVTREQLAAIFYHYAKYKGYDLSPADNLSKFTDKKEVSDWAKEAMQWAVGCGLLNGKSNHTLDPKGAATRAEIAAMLHRFILKNEPETGKAADGFAGGTTTNSSPSSPKTGDSSAMTPWTSVLLFALAASALLALLLKKHKAGKSSAHVLS